MPQYQYQKITDLLRRRIRSGTYAPGEQLPTRRELCAELDVSDIVIGSAMRILRAEGLVESLPGAGVWVANPLPPEPAGRTPS
jgi:GntR family transcriptional regulator